MCSVSDHRKAAWAIREAETALRRLQSNSAMTRNERRRVGTMLKSLGEVRESLEGKLLWENPGGGGMLTRVYRR